MRKRGSRGVGVIGGEDGPTSVYLIKQSGKKSLKRYIMNLIYKYKGKRAEKTIVPGAHTLPEVVAYATEVYAAEELDNSHRRYASKRDCMKESLIARHRPDLLGKWKDIPFVETENKAEFNYWIQQYQKREEHIASIPDSEISMDFHVYEIKIQGGRLELELDYAWNELRVCYSGNKKAIRKLKKIAQELAVYYGVTADDIADRTERYTSLLASLSH